MSFTLHTVHARTVDDLGQIHTATYAFNEFALEVGVIEIALPYAVELLNTQVCRSAGVTARDLSWEVHLFVISREDES